MSYLKPKTYRKKEKILSDYQAAEYYVILTSAICGGIESPIQFIIQVLNTIVLYQKLFHK